MSWQPIETAPRNGEVVLLFGDWAGEINGPDDAPGVWPGYYANGHTDYAGYDWVVVGSDAHAAWCKPTHWMPLPPAPDAAA